MHDPQRRDDRRERFEGRYAEGPDGRFRDADGRVLAEELDFTPEEDAEAGRLLVEFHRREAERKARGE